MPEFSGLKVTQDEGAARAFDLRWVKSEAKPGLSFEQGVIHTGANSGYQALNLAVLLGAKRIVLLGFDMRKVASQSHFFGDHPGKMNEKSPYDVFIRNFSTTLPCLTTLGVEVINCTPESALTCFPQRKLEEIL